MAIEHSNLTLHVNACTSFGGVYNIYWGDSGEMNESTNLLVIGNRRLIGAFVADTCISKDIEPMGSKANRMGHYLLGGRQIQGRRLNLSGS